MSLQRHFLDTACIEGQGLYPLTKFPPRENLDKEWLLSLMTPADFTDQKSIFDYASKIKKEYH